MSTEKLIRSGLKDKIKNDPEQKSKKPKDRITFRTAKKDEQLPFIVKKLREEVREFFREIKKKNLEGILEEYADIMEVIDAAYLLPELNPRVVSVAKAKKYNERGGFEHFIIATFPGKPKWPKEKKVKKATKPKRR